MTKELIDQILKDIGLESIEADHDAGEHGHKSQILNAID